MCMYLSVYYAYRYPQRPEEGSVPRTDIIDIVNCLVWVLEKEPKSSARTRNVLLNT